MFRDLDDEIVGNAILISGKQLFIDDHVIEELKGATRVLNQPVKHSRNPLLKRDQPWETSGPGYGTVLYDAENRLFKMWYENWDQNEASSARLLYATSKNGLDWEKPFVDEERKTNLVRRPDIKGFQACGIFRDPVERDPARRYKMLFSCNPDGTATSWTTAAAFSADGIKWTANSESQLIPFSDAQSCPLWDARRGRYVAILRFGPPNTRIISRTESTDFLHWSPKVTVLRRTKMDEPMATQFYQMSPLLYGDIFLGLLSAYHNETLKPLPPDQPWTDRKNLHLVFSRNGVTWQRVGKNGAIPPRDLEQDRDWQRIAQDAVFLPYGTKDKDWDWGTVAPYFMPEPIFVGDEIWFYYVGQKGRNWWNYTGDPPKLDKQAREPLRGVGLATLRRDGFVSVETQKNGTLTTKPLVFLGDTLVVNANAKGGSLVVEAIDDKGKSIPGFSSTDCKPITTDGIRHVVTWKGKTNCHLLQARPIRLRFHLTNAKLYSFEPAIRHKHYLQSYD
ncbi:MAG: hypothetical protein FJ271_01960 [Planctomycetes bacterium]|nr:hypothetical protein [Planctomycetota bacterium]